MKIEYINELPFDGSDVQTLKERMSKLLDEARSIRHDLENIYGVTGESTATESNVDIMLVCPSCGCRATVQEIDSDEINDTINGLWCDKCDVNFEIVATVNRKYRDMIQFK